MRELWTIGHGTRSVEDLIAALRAHRIAVLADVRQFPGSKRNPQFSQAPLRDALRHAGIQYVHFADLGGYRHEGYEAWMQGTAWRAAFAQLAALAEAGGVCIMCAETSPAGCHRRSIAAHAERAGWAVTHILDAERTLPAERARQARLDAEGSSDRSA
ncbi:MAG: DUF488 domain-containing protein [Halobacteriales archaeon]|nr:DUF488 domain-containing protein [Halobacteriales archaeon]